MQLFNNPVDVKEGLSHKESKGLPPLPRPTNVQQSFISVYMIGLCHFLRYISIPPKMVISLSLVGLPMPLFYRNYQTTNKLTFVSLSLIFPGLGRLLYEFTVRTSENNDFIHKRRNQATFLVLPPAYFSTWPATD